MMLDAYPIGYEMFRKGEELVITSDRAFELHGVEWQTGRSKETGRELVVPTPRQIRKNEEIRRANVRAHREAVKRLKRADA